MILCLCNKLWLDGTPGVAVSVCLAVVVQLLTVAEIKVKN